MIIGVKMLKKKAKKKIKKTAKNALAKRKAKGTPIVLAAPAAEVATVHP
jgi:hypothetical protein